MWKSALILISLLNVAAAEAATRSFSSPATEGVRIASCLADGTSCGKLAADVFCQREGFKESILFGREMVASTRPLDSENLCENGQCEAFTKIKCYQPQTVEQVSN